MLRATRSPQSRASRSRTCPLQTFIDTNPLGLATDFTATIDWGDGTTSTGTLAGAGHQRPRARTIRCSAATPIPGPAHSLSA